jgi:hypothetical protein
VVVVEVLVDQEAVVLEVQEKRYNHHFLEHMEWVEMVAADQVMVQVVLLELEMVAMAMLTLEHLVDMVLLVD